MAQQHFHQARARRRRQSSGLSSARCAWASGRCFSSSCGHARGWCSDWPAVRRRLAGGAVAQAAGTAPQRSSSALFGLAFAVALAGAGAGALAVRDAGHSPGRGRVRHQASSPASSYEDTLTLGAQRCPHRTPCGVCTASVSPLMLQKLRVGPPLSADGPLRSLRSRALRPAGCIRAARSWWATAPLDRLRSAFRFGALAKGAEARIDAWVTPPAYTGKPPIMLADGGFSGLRPAEKPAGPMEIPDRSVLVVRGSGAALGARSPGGARRRGVRAALGRRHPPARTDVAELKFEVRKSAPCLGLRQRHSSLLSWPFVVMPDHPPKIALTKEPERTPRGALKLTFKVEDDYGVVSAEGRIRRVRPKEDKSPPPGHAPAPRRGPRPPYESPPALALRLPRAYPKQAEGQSFHEIGDHLWAGMKVELTLVPRTWPASRVAATPLEIVLPSAASASRLRAPWSISGAGWPRIRATARRSRARSTR